MRTRGSVSAGLIFVLLLGGTAWTSAAEKSDGKGKSLDPAGIERLKQRAGGHVRVTTSEATGAVRFAAVEPGAAGDLMAPSAAPAVEKARQFLRDYSGVFGISDADAELQLGRDQSDEIGARHLTFFQTYRGVPVFAGLLRAHFGAGGELTAINGNFIPYLRLNPVPTMPAATAGAAAIAAVSADNSDREVWVRSGILMIYRTGLAQGIPGENHLTWQMEVGNDADIREFVYVDAHTGKVVDRLPGIFDALNRKAYDGQFSTTVPPPNYPGNPFWVEGQAFPTGNAEADNMITSSKETYDLYSRSFGRDSFNGAGATMESIFNRGNACPNASWNGDYISFCNGLTTDDVTGHEWTHAYTQYTHGLIYAWQPGALNESYSDIFGETIDRINGRDNVGNSATDPARLGVVCSTYTPLPTVVRINSPAAIAGDKPAGTAQFGPSAFHVTNDVVLVNDGVGNPTPPSGAPGDLSVMDGCETPFTNAAALAGKIALVYRGTCGFAVKVKNAQVNGAAAVIVANHTAGGNALVTMAGADATIVIGSLFIGNTNGEAIRGQLASTTVNATLDRGQFGSDPSTRWLIGEDDTAVGLTGALRDMFNPPCYLNPGKVSDTLYGCGTADQGGVHNNSGVPNHAYALITDGGTYNGQTISGIGLTKAAHIYFRAMTVYQHPATDFADHADAIEQSATDLIGVNLNDLNTGLPSGQVISASDVDEVKKAMLAVEMRTPPACTFQPLLAQNPPALCPAPTKVQAIFEDTFEEGDHEWAVGHDAVVPTDFTSRDWEIVSDLPDRSGHAFFALDPAYGSCLASSVLANNEAGVLHLTSEQITLPSTATNPKLTFVHWVATEPAVDGGNISISVNGGAWQPIKAADFIYNAYTGNLLTAAAGNTNPMAGQPAWSGSDGGSVLGTWGRSIVNLAPYAKAKDRIRLRFDFGTDCATGFFGWYVDDVTVYRCK